MAENIMYKICFFVPETQLESVKTAMFVAGGGRIGDYSHCCWQVLGQGQFMPLTGAKPFLGDCGRLEQVAEYRVEMVCDDAVVTAVISALRLAHPYEEPAYDVLQCVDI